MSAWLVWRARQPGGPTTALVHPLVERTSWLLVAVLAVVFAGRADAGTALGAQVYFWARVAYLPIYAIGIPYLRTAVWIVSLWGLLQLVQALF